MRSRLMLVPALAMLLALIILQMSQAQIPVTPHAFYGIVKVEDANPSPDSTVSAGCSGAPFGQDTQLELIGDAYWYDLEVPGDILSTPGTKEGCQPGETVRFKVDEYWADESASWSEGGSDRLDLNAYPPRASLILEKHTNGQDADVAPGPDVLHGDPVTWTYVITNTGSVTLTGITVDDDPAGAASCPGGPLRAGESMVCTLSGVAGTGQYANLGTAWAVWEDELYGTTVVSDTDPSHYFGAVTAIDLEKTTNGVDADSPSGPTVLAGSTVNWAYVVTNLSNVPLDPVTVEDSVPGVTVDCGGTDRLAVDESMTCTASGTAITGQYSNLGTATGLPPGGLAEVSDSDASHYLGVNPAINLEKRTNGQDADGPPGPYILEGDPVSWTYQITNDGDIFLTNIVLTDNRLGRITPCAATGLAAGQSTTCTASGTATAGQYSNSATVTATPLGMTGVSVDDTDQSHYFGARLGVGFDKRTEGADADAPPGPTLLAGEPVLWTYHLTNTGNVTLTIVAVEDDLEGPADCPQGTLVPGASVVCDLAGTVQAGAYANQGTVTVQPPGGLAAFGASDPSHYYGAQPGIAVEKSTNGQDADAPIGPYLRLGDPVTWTYVIRNTGNITLTGISALDDRLGAVACGQSTLAPGEEMTCTETGTVLATGQYANRVDVSGQPPVGPAVTAFDLSHYFGIAPAIALTKYTNGQDANEVPGPRIYVGEVVTWTYEVLNSGDITLTQISVVDDVQGVADCPGQELAPGLAMTCQLTGTATLGQYANLGTVSGQPPAGPPVTASDFSHYQGRIAAPAIDVEKKTNGLDADVAPGPYVPVGGAVEWIYTVANIGNVDLTSVTVVDDQLGALTCPRDRLRENQDMTCSASGVAEAGQYGNVVTATATADPGGGPVIVVDTDPSHYFGSQPGIEIQKYTNGLDADEAPGAYVPAGGAVTWTYVVTNSGNVALSGVQVVDDVQGQANCPRTTLAPGAMMTCSLGGVAAEGQHANLATVTGTPPVGAAVSATDPSHYFGAILALSFEKRINGQPADAPPGPLIPVGEALTWTYWISSESNVTLTLEVVDSQEAVTCDETTLIAGGSTMCSAEGVATAGQYANTGIVTATPPGGLAPLVRSDSSHYYGSDPGIRLEKRTNGQDADAAPGPYVPLGGDVRWTYHVSNTGNVTLTAVAVSDDQGVVVNCSQAVLAPAESTVCEASGTAQIGQYENLGSASGTPPVGETVRDTDPSHYFGSQPGIVLEKLTNGRDADLPPGPTVWEGDTVEWLYQVRNSGNVPLTSIQVVDDQGEQVDCPQSTLAPGQSMTCTASGTAVAGQYGNLGTASGFPPVGAKVSDSDPSHYFARTHNPAIDLEKWTNGLDADRAPGPWVPVGEPIEWHYFVGNPGDVTLSDVTVSDDQLGGTVCYTPTLEAGASFSCTVQAEAQPGPYHNTGTVTGTVPLGYEIEASDESHYYGIAPALAFQKRTNGQDADEAPGVYLIVGRQVSWSYLVTNTGNVTLTQVLVSDDQEGGLVCAKAELAPGEVLRCQLSGTAAAGPYSNTGYVSATPPLGEPLTASDPSHYSGVDPGIRIAKSTNGEDADTSPGPYLLVGEPVTWTYRVRNTGDITLTQVTVGDDQGVQPLCPDDVLGPGAEMVCTATSVAGIGQYANLGTATGRPPGGLAPVSHSDPSHYLGLGIAPALDIQKRTNGSDADTAPGPYILLGNPVEWEYLVTNVGGSVKVENITVTDDRVETVVCPPNDGLLVGQSLLCTASGVAELGQYGNQATVTGTVQYTGEVITDTDRSHYFGSAPALDLRKRTNGLDVEAAPGPTLRPGEPITWTYVVSNVGNVVLTDLMVMDDQGPDVACPSTTLAVSASMTCTATGVVDAGQYRNVGIASAFFGGGRYWAWDTSFYLGLYEVYLPLIQRR